MKWKEICETASVSGLTEKILQSRRSHYNYVHKRQKRQERDTSKKRKADEVITISDDDGPNAGHQSRTKKVKVAMPTDKNRSEHAQHSEGEMFVTVNAAAESLPTPPSSSTSSPPLTSSPASRILSESGDEMLKKQKLILDRLSRDYTDHVSKMDDSLGTKKYKKEYQNYDRELRAYVGRQIDREQRIEKGLPVEDEFEAPPIKDPPRQTASKPTSTPAGRKEKTPLEKEAAATANTELAPVSVGDLTDADAEGDIDEDLYDPLDAELEDAFKQIESEEESKRAQG